MQLVSYVLRSLTSRSPLTRSCPPICLGPLCSPACPGSILPRLHRTVRGPFAASLPGCVLHMRRPPVAVCIHAYSSLGCSVPRACCHQVDLDTELLGRGNLCYLCESREPSLLAAKMTPNCVHRRALAQQLVCLWQGPHAAPGAPHGGALRGAGRAAAWPCCSRARCKECAPTPLPVQLLNFCQQSWP